MRTIASLFSALVLLFVASTGFAQEAAVGQPAPDFTLVDEAGVSHTLSQYQGQIVVLEWTNPECPFVQRCYNNTRMQTAAGSFDGQSVVWLAVDSTHFNDASTNVAWKAQHGFEYPTLQDRDGTVGHLYGATTTPHLYVVDAAGLLRYAGAFDSDPRGEEAAPTNYVTDAVTALLAGNDPAVASSEPWGCSVKYDD